MDNFNMLLRNLSSIMLQVHFPGTTRITAGRRQTYNATRLEYGGIVSGATGGASIDYGQLSRIVVDAVSALPPQYVRVGDIRNRVGKQVKVEQKAEIGI